jgi:hypothetical protein
MDLRARFRGALLGLARRDPSTLREPQGHPESAGATTLAVTSVVDRRLSQPKVVHQHEVFNHGVQSGVENRTAVARGSEKRSNLPNVRRDCG